MPHPAREFEVVRCTPADVGRTVVGAASLLLGDLVRGGAALGWVEAPETREVADLLAGVVAGAEAGDAALVLGWRGSELAGLGY